MACRRVSAESIAGRWETLRLHSLLVAARQAFWCYRLHKGVQLLPDPALDTHISLTFDDANMTRMHFYLVITIFVEYKLPCL